MIIVDASTWVASLIAADVHNKVSAEFIDAWFRTGQNVSVPAVFPPEVMGAISRLGMSEIFCRGATKMVLNNHFVQIHTIAMDLSRQSAEIAMNHHSRSADAVYVALADQLSVPFVTWDKEQLERGGQIVRTMTPEQAFEELL